MKYSLLILLFISANIFAQKSATESKGDKYFIKYAFDKAIVKYKSAKDLTVGGKRNLAVSYLNIKQYDLAEDAYNNLTASKEATSEDWFNYANTLKSNGKYPESSQAMEKFSEKSPNDLRAKDFQENKEKLETIKSDKGRYKIVNLDLNTADQDFGPAYYFDKIVYASTKEKMKGVKRTYNWNNLPYLNLYNGTINDKQITETASFGKVFDEKMHVGPASFTSDGMFMAFTRNNPDKKSAKGTIVLELYFSTKGEEEWSESIPFKLNNPEYSVGQPWLSGDGNVLYFVSDMPGGKGGTDIYRVEKDATGKWGEAVNLDGINTESNEMFPFYQEEQEILFFSSEGHFGLGGLDVFIAPNYGDKFGKVFNAGYPLNTQYDDFSLIVDEKMTTGYFSSNREGGKGNDDIYSFDLLKPFSFGTQIKGLAKDSEGNLLANTEVTLFNDGYTKTITTDETGSFKFNVKSGENWILKGEKDKYNSSSEKITNSDKGTDINKDIVLKKREGISLYTLVTDKETDFPLKNVKVTFLNNDGGEEFEKNTMNSGDFLVPLKDAKVDDKISYNIKFEKEGFLSKTVTYSKTLDHDGKYNVHEELDISLDKIDVGKDLGTIIDIQPIYFDFNKYVIREDAGKELDKIVQVMQDNPTMEVELGSHTDCRGKNPYNKKLSDKRAKASAKYIKSRITNPERIYGKGYGEEELIIKCKRCYSCTDEQHQVNRRTEFRIIKM